MLFLDTEQDERTAVKTALALAISRYRDTIGKFVQDKAPRLALVETQIARISSECAEMTRANPEEVERKFRSFLADAVAVSEPERVKVDEKGGEETETSKEVPQPEHGVRVDIKAGEPVLDGEPAQVDLGSESTVDSNSYISKTANPNAVNCPYCGHTMTAVQNAQNPAMSGQQQQCPNCGAQIQATPGDQMAPGMAGGAGAAGMMGGGMMAKVACERCSSNDAQENSILCEACNKFVVTGQGEGLEDPQMPIEEGTQSPVEEDATEQQLPPALEEDSNGPAEVYTGVVQQTANSNAAMAWSTPGDQDVDQISQQYGLDPEEVRANLIIVADFGDALAVNGDPNADPSTDGYAELPSFGGRIPSTEEEVDVDNAIQNTADRTNLSTDDVYALVKESYGADLGGQHYVSVTGEAHYYLPEEMVGSATQGPDIDSPEEMPQEAVQSSVPAHLRSLSAYLEWEAQHVSA